jgi:CRP-like cAMP-binding protein
MNVLLFSFLLLLVQGNEPYVLLRSKGAGESFGELAMMYDTTRNATVKSTTHALLWAVDRVTFKAILGEHLTGSSTAQVIKELTTTSIHTLCKKDPLHNDHKPL